MAIKQMEIIRIGNRVLNLDTVVAWSWRDTTLVVLFTGKASPLIIEGDEARCLAAALELKIGATL